MEISANYKDQFSDSGRRDIGWLLRRLWALAALLLVSVVGCEYCMLILAERALAVAAREGALEATLPKATPQSVAAAVTRTLAAYPWRDDVDVLPIALNGEIAQRRWRARRGDNLTIALMVPHTAIVPHWIAQLAWKRTRSPLRVSATYTVGLLSSR